MSRASRERWKARNTIAEPFIVKVQTPLAGAALALVYNEDRSVQEQYPIDKGIKRMMRGRAKAFFWARLDGGTLTIGQESEWQSW